jgi:selenocysteine lyase/cysteine desulfurase/tRNA(Ile)-lysidine synthase TilS/MesJ
LKHYSNDNNNNNNNNNHNHNKHPLILVGPLEHHSNLIPWRELLGFDIVTINYSQQGNVDMDHLKLVLQQEHLSRPFIIGSFAAVSNLTGTVTDDLAITALLHTYGALSVWDYATGASYMAPNMNPTNDKLYSKDAVVWSGHKLLGASSTTPGVLIVKKHLVSQVNPPTLAGGGTVFYVSQQSHRFLSNRIERWEGGTPNIVGIWRLGLAVKLKHDLSRIARQVCGNNKTLLDLDLERAQQIQQRLLQIPNLVLLDNVTTQTQTQTDARNNTKKVPIFFFLIKCGTRFLHYNFVCALLNDMFGIQSRGGCQCAGPYAQLLLGLDAETNHAVEQCLIHTKDELLRPGATRLSLPTIGCTKEQEEYVVNAIAWIAKHGWKCLHVYRVHPRAGEWRHKSRIAMSTPLGRTERQWLATYSIFDTGDKPTSSEIPCLSLDEALANADSLLEHVILKDQTSIVQTLKMTEHTQSLSTLRWYVHPKDVAEYIQQHDTIEHIPGTLNRDNLLGPIRPIAWYGRVAASSSIAAQSAPAGHVESEVKNNGGSKPSSLATDGTSQKALFREGEHHSGEATLEEIQMGWDDGELSENCLIYDASIDSWLGISEYFEKLSQQPQIEMAATVATDISQRALEDAHLESKEAHTHGEVPVKLLHQYRDKKNDNGLISFRDGEHTGKSSWEEVEVGFHDGELSDSCEVYDQAKDSWRLLRDVLPKNHSPTVDTEVDDDDVVIAVAGTLSTPPDYGFQVVDKNEKKKPSRDSSTWGQGSMVTLNHTIPPETVAPAQTAPATKPKRHKHIKPPAKLMRLVTQAMIQWDMLEDGDRLLLGLSGGKDSMSLLHVLLEFQKKLPIKFDIEVCTIDPMTPSFDPSPMIPYIESLGLKYHFIRDDIVERASKAGKDGNIVSSLCSYCARMKRGNLYTCARRNNCNKLVLAQHLDDLAESFMMSVMHNGFLRTMKANYKINAGDLSVIRPLVYCRESLMTDFAKSAKLPIINENCPACFEEPKERARVKKLLSREETLYPNFYDNLKRSMLPLMHADSTSILRSYTEEALAKSRKNQNGKRRPNGSNLKKDTEKPHEIDSGEDSVASTPSQAVGRGITIDSSSGGALLSEASDEDLVRELARRRAERFRLAGAMKRLGEEDDDPTGQVCTLNGGDGSIPCRELME